MGREYPIDDWRTSLCAHFGHFILMMRTEPFETIFVHMIVCVEILVIVYVGFAFLATCFMGDWPQLFALVFGVVNLVADIQTKSKPSKDRWHMGSFPAYLMSFLFVVASAASIHRAMSAVAGDSFFVLLLGASGALGLSAMSFYYAKTDGRGF